MVLLPNTGCRRGEIGIAAPFFFAICMPASRDIPSNLLAIFGSHLNAPTIITNVAREKGCSGWREAACVNTQVSSTLCMSWGLHCHCGLNYNGTVITHTSEWYSTPSLHLKYCYKGSTWEVVCVEISFNWVVSSDPHCCPAFTYCKNDMYIYVYHVKRLGQAYQ